MVLIAVVGLTQVGEFQRDQTARVTGGIEYTRGLSMLMRGGGGCCGDAAGGRRCQPTETAGGEVQG